MIKTWHGQTKEEWEKEYYRDKALTPEEKERELNEYIQSINKKWDKYYTTEEKKKQPKESIKEQYQRYDHPNSLENDEATIIWVVVMAIATIFKGNWIIWIIATIVWRRYITRHKIKK